MNRPSTLRFLLLLCAVTLLPCGGFAADRTEFHSALGWMPMQPVNPGQNLEVDMRRFYFARPGAGDRIVLPDSEPGRFAAEFDAANYRLSVRVAPEAAGLIEVPIQVFQGDGDEPVLCTVLVLAVQPSVGHTFKFRPEGGQPEKVRVAGQFNGWNSESHELVRQEDGSFELFVPMSSGSHAYKFVVDGEWITDSSNPEQADDGTGNFNSVVRVGGAAGGQPPVVFAEKADGDRVSFRVVGSAAIDGVSAVAQWPCGRSYVTGHEVSGDRVKVGAEGLPDGTWVRVVVTDANGNISNAARAPVRPLKVFQWQDGIIYYAFTDRFANGDKDNDRPVEDERVLPQANYQGGDFQGIQQKVDEGYFRGLGVNVLWLAPINRNPDGAWQEHVPPYRFYTGYHGYWPVSHTEIEPRFGGEDALKEMISTAHAADMRIIADLVLKHVHQEHPMWTEQRELFGNIDLPDGTKNLRKWDDEFQFTTWFEEWLPGFDFDKPEAVDFLLANAVDFAERFKLDGYRLDAVKHIKHEFWWRYRTEMNNLVQPSREALFYSVGETFMDRTGIMSFVGPNMLDGQFDFPLYDTMIDVFAKGHQGMDELERSLAASELIYGKETLMSPLVGNHDKPRFMAYADGDLPDPNEPDEIEVGYNNPPKVDNPASYEKLKLALTFVLSIDGVPMIYYGDEIGMTGAGDPDNRRFMQWEDLDAKQVSVREHFSKVAAARNAHPALRYGSRRPLVAGCDRFAFVRAHLGDAVLAVWNRGGSSASFSVDVGPEMPDGVYEDALGTQTIEVKDGRAEFEIPGMTSALFAAKPD